MTIELLALILRIAIIAVLLVSGGAKLLDRDGSIEAMHGFGVPDRLAMPAALALPWVEIALALGLIFAATQPWAALVATVLFLVFTAGVLRIVLRAENVDCHCFGQLSTEPVSWWTVVRNSALTVAATAVSWNALSQSSRSIWDEFTWPRLGALAIVAGFAVMAWVIRRLWLNQLELLDRIDTLQSMIPAGRVPIRASDVTFADVAHGMSVTSLDGQVAPITSLVTPRQPNLLVFVSDRCRACTALLPEIAGWQQEFSGLMPVIVLGRGEVGPAAVAAGIGNVVLLPDDELAHALKVNGNPNAVLVDHDGVIRQKPMLGGAAVRRLIEGLRAQVPA